VRRFLLSGHVLLLHHRKRQFHLGSVLLLSQFCTKESSGKSQKSAMAMGRKEKEPSARLERNIYLFVPVFAPLHSLAE
jgi:hypothetical protein